jgi:hypothetical protein
MAVEKRHEGELQGLLIYQVKKASTPSVLIPLVVTPAAFKGAIA